MRTIDLSEDQKSAIHKLYKWFKTESKTPYITLGGYAGTGKTTIVAILRQALATHYPDTKVAFCSYTGKATRVLQSTLENLNAKFPKDNISTIHGLIYEPIESSGGVITGWKKKELVKQDLIVVDEASMVDQMIWADLLSFGKPIIAVGDHGQLPPINGEFNLMQKPNIRLEQIHRQAQDNPIIKVSIMARKNGEIPFEEFGKNIQKFSNQDFQGQELVNSLMQEYSKETLILCGYNTTRIKANNFIRQSLGFEETEPQVGDRVICLRNNHEKKIFNGMIGTILDIQEFSEEWYLAEYLMDGETYPYKGLSYKPQFNAPNPINFTDKRIKAAKGDLFDFGYALTVHKAQGSQSKRVVLFEERFKQMSDEMWRRWLYTAVTRAEEELFVVSGG